LWNSCSTFHGGSFQTTFFAGSHPAPARDWLSSKKPNQSLANTYTTEAQKHGGELSSGARRKDKTRLFMPTPR
jgi:hypothetical protein